MWKNELNINYALINQSRCIWHVSSCVVHVWHDSIFSNIVHVGVKIMWSQSSNWVKAVRFPVTEQTQRLNICRILFDQSWPLQGLGESLLQVNRRVTASKHMAPQESIWFSIFAHILRTTLVGSAVWFWQIFPLRYIVTALCKSRPRKTIIFSASLIRINL